VSLANPAEQLDLPILFFASFFWQTKERRESVCVKAKA